MSLFTLQYRKCWEFALGGRDISLQLLGPKTSRKQFTQLHDKKLIALEHIHRCLLPELSYELPTDSTWSDKLISKITSDADGFELRMTHIDRMTNGGTLCAHTGTWYR